MEVSSDEELGVMKYEKVMSNPKMEKVKINGIKAIYVERLSWTHRKWYSLENGCLISVAWSEHYGSFVNFVEDATGFWRASDGINTLPERFKWILEWEKPIAPGHWDKLLYPEITYYEDE